MERTITVGTNTQRPILPRTRLPRLQRYGPSAYRNYSGDRLTPANPTYTKHNHSAHKKTRITAITLPQLSLSRNFIMAPFLTYWSLTSFNYRRVGGFVLTRINLQVRKRTPCYYSRSHSCYSCHSTATTVLVADSDSESNQPAKSRKVRNAREMFRRKETILSQ
jgi:hypothetical protein